MNNTLQICGHLVDTQVQKIYYAKIIIKNDHILKIERLDKKLPEGTPFIMPGFIDSHVHIESSMLTPAEWARTTVRHGTVGAICDPHEIANVMGVAGIDFMIDNSKGGNFNFMFGASSCVPCSPFETAGETIDSKDIETLMSRPEIGFLSEMMNVPGVLGGNPEVMAKLKAAQKYGKPVDGHAPTLVGKELEQYAAAGISSDHECSSMEEAEERIALGMDVLIREGSAAKNYEALSALIDEHPDSCMFCTDDKHPDELAEGHINELVKRSVQKGYNLWNILKASSVNPVHHYHLNCGLLQEGDKADFILVDNLKNLNVLATFINGVKVFDKKDADCATALQNGIKKDFTYPNHFCAKPLTENDIRVVPQSNRMRVIQAYNSQLLTSELEVVPTLDDINNVISNPSEDILKMVVYNRYEANAKPTMAFIKGFGFQNAAIAASYAHDSHNIIAVGTSDKLIVKAINKVVEMQGGLEIVCGEEKVAIPLPIAGLISPLPVEKIIPQFARLNEVARKAKCKFDAPFMTLSFMALTVIPDLKLSDKGLFDVRTFHFTSLFR